mgnify:CR=1 FL=1
MNRLVSKLKRIKDENRKFLVAYLTGGVPDISGTVEYARALEMGGADIIEIGIPFSDALADGPVNQEAALVAIKGARRGKPATCTTNDRVATARHAGGGQCHR